MGRIVKSYRVEEQMWDNGNQVFDCTNLTKGIYYILFYDKNLKLIKREIYVNY